MLPPRSDRYGGLSQAERPAHSHRSKSMSRSIDDRCLDESRRRGRGRGGGELISGLHAPAIRQLFALDKSAGRWASSIKTPALAPALTAALGHGIPRSKCSSSTALPVAALPRCDPSNGDMNDEAEGMHSSGTAAIVTLFKSYLILHVAELGKLRLSWIARG
jgi:hypothetical protein